MSIINTQKRITIVGMGITGLSCARFFAHKKMPFRVVDSRQTPALIQIFDSEFPDVEKNYGDLAAETFSPDDLLVVSPGMSLQEPLVARAIENRAQISSDIEIFLQEVSAPVVAITGSNGKSTVTTLVGEMCRQAGRSVCVAGNIGLPVLEQLLDKETYDVFVLELSSFQLERLHAFKAKAVTILNVTEDHMDRYNSFSEYHAAKQKIFMGAENIIINRDDALTSQGLPANATICSYGLTVPVDGNFGVRDFAGKEFIVCGHETVIAVDEIKIKGRHNIANAMAALALGKTLGLFWPPMIKALQDFSGLRHRCEWVDDIDGVAFYNDSKATNVGAAIAAIAGFPKGQGKLILVAGGQDKDSDFSPLGDIVRSHVARVFLIGKDAPKLYQAFGAEFCSFAKTLSDAVNDAFAFATKGDVILLAPACASFDMFKNYEHRGDVFVESVKALKAARQ